MRVLGTCGAGFLGQPLAPAVGGYLSDREGWDRSIDGIVKSCCPGMECDASKIVTIGGQCWLHKPYQSL